MIRTLAVTMVLSAMAIGAHAQTAQSPEAPKPAQPAQPASPELPATSLIRPDKTMLLIPGRELTIAWTMPEPPTQVSEGAAPPHGLPPARQHHRRLRPRHRRQRLRTPEQRSPR